MNSRRKRRLEDSFAKHNIDFRNYENQYAFRDKDMSLARRIIRNVVGDSFSRDGYVFVIDEEESQYMSSLRIAVSNESEPTEVDEELDRELAEKCIRVAELVIDGCSGMVEGTNKENTNYIISLDFATRINIVPESCTEEEIDLCESFWKYEVWLCNNDALMSSELQNAIEQYRKCQEVKDNG